MAPCDPHGAPWPPQCPLQLPFPHRLQGKPALQLPLAGSHPYDHITVESAFDNPTYETGVSTGLHTPHVGLGTLGTLHCMGHLCQGLGQVWDRVMCSRNHTVDRTSIQEQHRGWDMHPETTCGMMDLPRVCSGMDIQLGTMHRMEH